MNTFSISQLAQYSGIKAHTIRIWEQRYKALTPERSEGNTRHYNGFQLRRLLNIASLTEAGFKISDLCAMPDEKLFQLVDGLISRESEASENEYYISQLIAAGIAYDELHFEKIFSHCLLRNGITNTYTQILYPLLVRMGMMWAGDTLSPVSEHFISNYIRQKLFTAIDSLPPAKATADTWLLFLPENEFHEIGLLMANYLIRFSGMKVIYMGGNVPLDSLSDSIQKTNPQHILFFLVHRGLAADIENYLTKLDAVSSGKNIYISADSKLNIKKKPASNVRWLKSPQDLIEQLPITSV